ncbi:MAG TPA: protein kinase [Ktedonobacterales bacterium]|nr:protein kinase [Ktedonobacterales bacterium]
MSTEHSHVGLRLLNRYLIDEPLSSGTLCHVYRGRDTVLRRSIAVKAVTPDWLETYRGALRDTAALSHPAIVATYDALEQDGWLYIIQEYVTARPLTTYLRDGVPSERAVDLAGQIARTLAYAHAHGMTHGDLTPAAVLVDRQATVRINNFQLPADDAYFAARASEWDMSLEMLLPPDGDRAPADVTAAGLLLWLLLSEPKGSTQEHGDTGGAGRAFRPDVPDLVRELVRRCVRRTEASAVTNAEMLCSELEQVAREVAKPRSKLAEHTPPALVVARAAAEHEPARSAEMTLSGRRSWEPIVVGDPISYSAPTVPQATETGPWLSSVPTASIAPRLRLPSRPMPEYQAGMYAAPQSAQSLAAAEQTSENTLTNGLWHNGQLKLWVLVAIGIALFVLFFLIGFYMPYRLGG